MNFADVALTESSAETLKMRLSVTTYKSNLEMEKPASLYEESFELIGARKMLLRLRDSYRFMPKTKTDKDDAVYLQAELDLIVSSQDNTRHFLCGDYRIHYRNHQRDKKGKLIKVEAYFAP